jgi:mandelate racemase
VTDPLLVRAVRARAVNVPIAPLRTASGTIASCPLVLIDAVTSDDRIVGRSYLFAYTPLCLAPLAELVQSLGASLAGGPAAPLTVFALLRQRLRLVGAGGLVAMALGGLDMALWDAQAKAAGRPLARLLGAAPRALPAYWSVGMCDPAEARRAAEAALAHGCRALKIKIGHTDAAEDLAAVRAVREVGGLALMVDYNQSLSVAEAKQRIGRLEQEGALQWIEEPTRAEDFAGHATIRRASRTPVQLGENWSSPQEMADSVAAGASDLAMLDAMKIGGVTGWLRAAALADAHGLPVSSHIFPELSAHLLTVTPTAHWLEYLDLASAVLATPARVTNGCVTASEEPGSGIEWNEAAIERFGH